MPFLTKTVNSSKNIEINISNKANGTVSGKVLLSKYDQQYLTLFDEE